MIYQWGSGSLLWDESLRLIWLPTSRKVRMIALISEGRSSFSGGVNWGANFQRFCSFANWSFAIR